MYSNDASSDKDRISNMMLVVCAPLTLSMKKRKLKKKIFLDLLR